MTGLTKVSNDVSKITQLVDDIGIVGAYIDETTGNLTIPAGKDINFESNPTQNISNDLLELEDSVEKISAHGLIKESVADIRNIIVAGTGGVGVATTVTIVPFEYWFNGVRKSYSGVTNQTFSQDPDEKFSLLYIDEFGNLQKAKNIFGSSTLAANNIIIGGFARVFGSGIIQSCHTIIPIVDGEIEKIQLRYGIGTIYTNGAGVITNSTTAKKLNIAGGDVFIVNGSNVPVSATSNVGFITAYRNGLGGYTYSTTEEDEIDSGFYDDGSGTLQPIPTGKWVAHTIIRDSTKQFGTEGLTLIYSKDVYNTEQIAQIQSPDYGEFLNVTGSYYNPISILVVEQGATSVSSFVDNRPAIGNSFVFSAASNQAADIEYNNSSSGLVAGDIQAAIDEIDTTLDTLTAADIANVPAGNIAATNVQAALNELDTEKSSVGHGHIGTEVSFAGVGISATNVQDAINEVYTQKGVASGLASLDGTGKLPVSQLPSSVMEYKGIWNATTNTPTLADGTGDIGDYYRVTGSGSPSGVAGGTGNFTAGDAIIYNGTVWEKSDTTDAVSSVNSQTGNVVLNATNIGSTPAGNIVATNVQAALNELDTEKLAATHTSAYGAHTANNITFTSSGDISATNVQAAIVEVCDDTNTKLSTKSDVGHNHAATGITNTPAGNIAATNVQAAINELDSEKVDVGHLSVSGAHTGTNISFAGVGISATNVQDAINEVYAQKGTVNGLATLDGSGKLPASQLPSSAMEYKGVWNATTNSPTLADGTGDIGDYYRVTGSGSPSGVANGAGDFNAGDAIIYNGTVWEKSDSTDSVSSVAGKVGAVTLTAADSANVPAGNITATNVQAAINELDSEKVDVGHLSVSGAHAASNITNTPAGGISATTVQAAINELDSEKVDVGHLSVSGAHAAANITNAPAGGISSTTVQAALNELDGDKSNVGHSHVASDVTNFQTTVSANTDVVANTTARHTHSNKVSVLDNLTSSGSGQVITTTERANHNSMYELHGQQSAQFSLSANTASFTTSDVVLTFGNSDITSPFVTKLAGNQTFEFQNAGKYKIETVFMFNKTDSSGGSSIYRGRIQLSTNGAAFTDITRSITFCTSPNNGFGSSGAHKISAYSQTIIDIPTINPTKDRIRAVIVLDQNGGGTETCIVPTNIIITYLGDR